MVSTPHLDLSLLCYVLLYITSLTSVHPVISHSSHSPLIFPSVCLCLPRLPLDSCFICIFPVLPLLYLSLVLCTHSSPESTLLFFASTCLSVTLFPKAQLHLVSSIRPPESRMNSSHLAPLTSVFHICSGSTCGYW